ncbi:hypothetical protein SDC9_208388 [bioreactor metagenome]|uniref:Uncharacterized protein n=1 Tax=bioreactor metagenome TaxID=1076179 RepID=A0A645JBE1_9ZZZZ
MARATIKEARIEAGTYMITHPKVFFKDSKNTGSLKSVL